MKRIYLSSILLLFTFCVHAQWRIAPEAGVTISKVGMYNAGVGARVGASVRYSFNKNDYGFGIRSGLYYIQHNTTGYSGSEIYYNLPGSSDTYVFSMMHGKPRVNDIHNVIPDNAELQNISAYYIEDRKDYLQLPVMAEYAWNLSSTIKYHIAAGPYVAMGIAGRSKTDISSWDFEGPAESKISTRSAFYNSSSRFDTGVSMQTGLQVDKFSFLLNYDVNLYKRNLRGKGHYISIGLGYTI